MMRQQEEPLLGPGPRTAALWQALRIRYPHLRLVDKGKSPLSRLIANLLCLVTAGRQRRYLGGQVTTLGQRIYVPSSWPELSDTQRYITLCHEAVHLAQFRRYGWLVMALLYLWPLCPIGLAWGRARIEWSAYRATLRAVHAVHGRVGLQDLGLRRHIIAQFTGPGYGWMWPFPRQVGRWYDAECRALLQAQSTPQDVP